MFKLCLQHSHLLTKNHQDLNTLLACFVLVMYDKKSCVAKIYESNIGKLCNEYNESVLHIEKATFKADIHR